MASTLVHQNCSQNLTPGQPDVEAMESMMSNLQYQLSPSRRQFVQVLGGCALSVSSAAALLSSESASAAALHLGSGVDISGLNKPTRLQGELTRLPIDHDRRLRMVNAHTGDDFDMVYYQGGEYLPDSVARFNHLMRDRRANIATNMDTTLYDQIFLIRQRLETKRPVHVLSGYRTAETNAKLRQRMKRVAKYSLHIEGRAADIFIPGIPIKTVHAAAVDLMAGGVGIYSNSHFVHIDTGPVRHWGR